MDVNPTFGRQELMETLSHSSTKSPGSIQSSQNSSSEKQSSSEQEKKEQPNSMDEAYRRVGQKLSLQAHGEDHNLPVSVQTIQPSARSSFERYQRQLYDDNNKRIRKVAKTDCTDHIEHNYRRSKSNVLRKLTVEGKQSFHAWESEQRRAFAKLDLGVDGKKSRSGSRSKHKSGKRDVVIASTKTSHASISSGTVKSHTKGLLSAVMEANSDSNASQTDRNSSNSASISSVKSQTTNSTSGQTPSTVPPRGKCLTQPADPVANEGRDNTDGNLIVYENDVIKAHKKQLHSFAGAMDRKLIDFRVHSFLGQGTFAQVFKCWHKATKQWVAMKVVRNRPDYTRQATVEIDVFRELARSTSGKRGRVDLIGFFMYHGHLCLVFELLGPNLYEILKKRQFRGLPLTTVRRILKQAVQTIRDISQKSIVHCDLKPENILLADEEAANTLIAMGEGRIRKNDISSSRDSSTSGSASNSQSREHSDNSGATTSRDSSGKSSSTEKHNNANPNLVNEGGKEAEDTIPIKLIDFGSACFEGYTSHAYIQSRFYRCPEVLLGVQYDSVIDMWSLGCVAAELFLGVPLLPGIHEHDQLTRVTEMIGGIPDWMLEQGSRSTKSYLKYVPQQQVRSVAPRLPQWRLKTQQEYIAALSQAEIKRKGGLARLEQQPGKRYFRRTRLADILFLHGRSTVGEDKELLPAFVHFLYGILDPDPWKRWTAFQAVHHPFLTRDLRKLTPYLARSISEAETQEENHANREVGLRWEAPWDPSICRRKLLNAQKKREKQQTARRAANRASVSSLVDSPIQSLGHTPSSTEESSDTRIGNSRMSSQPASGSTPPQHISSSSSSSQRTLSMPIASSKTNNVGAVPSNIGYAGNSTSASQHIHLQSRPLESHQHISDVGSVSVASGSFSGAIDGQAARVRSDVDFTPGFERPGNFPGQDFSSHQSVSSRTGLSSAGGSYASQPSHQQQPMHMGNMLHAMPSLNVQTQGNWGVGQPMQPVMQMGPQHVSSLPGQFVPTNTVRNSFDLGTSVGTSPSVHGPSVTPGHMSANDSIASSVTMEPDHTMMYPGMMPQMQAPAFFQQQVGMPQMHPAQMQQPNQYAAMPQQQVYLATGPNGSLCYVTTSATGQPILLQPMAIMDPMQQAQMQFQNPQGFGAMPQHQTFGYGQPNIQQQQQQMQFQQQPQQQQPHIHPPQHNPQRRGKGRKHHSRAGTSM